MSKVSELEFQGIAGKLVQACDSVLCSFADSVEGYRIVRAVIDERIASISGELERQQALDAAIVASEATSEAVGAVEGDGQTTQKD